MVAGRYHNRHCAGDVSDHRLDEAPHRATTSAERGAVTTILVFNTLAGLLMGWLYQSRGLLAAMVAQFVADSVRVIPLLSV